MTDEPRQEGVPEILPVPMTRREQRRAERERARVEWRAKRASRRTRHPFVVAGSILFTLILFLSLGALLAYTAGKRNFDAPGPLAQDKVVNLSGGAGDIADVLAREGVMEPGPLAKAVFMTASKVAEQPLKQGEYLFPKQVSISGIVDQLSEGKVVQHQITLPEGLTSQQIVARLMENDVLRGNLREVPKEGTLLPDTYNFPRGFPRDQLIQSLQAAQRRVLQQAWDRRNPDTPVKSPEQLLVLASIVEKETGKSDERARVAGVFANRLRQNMKLQSDPTTIYGLVGGKGSLGRQLMKRELEQPTPYNTYVILGLPPGPIANPGRASIEAAARPAKHKEIFFVADGTGGHAFAETLDQHNKNVARLRDIERQRNQQNAPGAPAAPGAAPSATQGAAPTIPPAALGPSLGATENNPLRTTTQ